MQQHSGEKPPPYTEAVGGHDQGMSNQNQVVAGYDQQNEVVVTNQSVMVDGQPATTVTVTQIKTFTYLRHPRRFEGKQNALNSLKGLLDVIHEEKKLPWSFIKKFIYKMGLLIYYLVNFIYSVIATGIQGDHIGYHLAYLFISLIGLAYEVTDVILDVRKWVLQYKKNQVKNMETRPRQGWTEGEGNMSLTSVESDEQNAQAPQDDGESSQSEEVTYKKKAKRVFMDYVVHSLGEMLIYPTFICVLYGFINEKAWQFNNGLSGFYFLLFLYSVVMDAIYTKIYFVWLVIRIVRASFTMHDDWCAQENEDTCTRFCTPIYLTVPFAVLLALAQWFMVGIIGARIYVDNFTPDYDTDGRVPNSGEYAIAPYTLYMIFCGVYLPIASWVVYIRLNRFWFYELYSLINQFSATPANYIWKLPLSMKTTAFIVDPVSYFVVIFLIVPFIVFTVATYLPDYDDSEFEVASSARNAVQGLGPCFIIFFLLANLQASIIFTILVIIIITILLYILLTLCAVAKCADDTAHCRC